jgi:hypothetical protein
MFELVLGRIGGSKEMSYVRQYFEDGGASSFGRRISGWDEPPGIRSRPNQAETGKAFEDPTAADKNTTRRSEDSAGATATAS